MLRIKILPERPVTEHHHPGSGPLLDSDIRGRCDDRILDRRRRLLLKLMNAQTEPVSTPIVAGRQQSTGR